MVDASNISYTTNTQTGASVIRRTGWNMPLEVDWDFQLDRLKTHIQTTAPADSGTLRHAFDDPDAITINAQRVQIGAGRRIDASDPTYITIKVDFPDPAARYARIQDQGGYVPPYNIQTAPPSPYLRRPRSKFMRAFINGQWRIFVRRKGFTLPGSNYIYRAVMRWFSDIQGTSGRQVVDWRDKHYSRGFE